MSARRPGDEQERDTALWLLVDLGTSAVNVARHLGHADLAWIAAERVAGAARLLDSPVMAGCATIALASARSAVEPVPSRSDSLSGYAERLEEQVGDDRVGRRFTGCCSLYAALARQVKADGSGAMELLNEAATVAGGSGSSPLRPGSRGMAVLRPGERVHLADDAGS